MVHAERERWGLYFIFAINLISSVKWKKIEKFWLLVILTFVQSQKFWLLSHFITILTFVFLANSDFCLILTFVLPYALFWLLSKMDFLTFVFRTFVSLTFVIEPSHLCCCYCCCWNGSSDKERNELEKKYDHHVVVVVVVVDVAAYNSNPFLSWNFLSPGKRFL